VYDERSNPRAPFFTVFKRVLLDLIIESFLRGMILSKINILVVDDELSMRQFLEILLKKEGYLVDTAANGGDALQKVKKKVYSVILMDYNMPEAIDGLPLLNEFRKMSPNTQVIVITAYSSTDQAIKAIELGAMDYVSKPFNVAEIKDIVKKALVEYDSKIPESQNSGRNSIPGKQAIISESREMRKVLSFAEQVAPTDSTVLLTGESGSGKEVLARYIHSISGRKNGPWYPINCGAIPENLQESELFGYKKGAFTGAYADKKGYFETANNGTLFMDEIGELSENMQVKMLRVLQERMFLPVGGLESVSTNARLISATNKDLREEIRKTAFREDLFFRLNVFELNIPPLRERKEDIIPLAMLFIESEAEKLNKTIRLSKTVEKFFMEYEFPGNVRELCNIIERGAVLAKSAEITMDEISVKNYSSAIADRRVVDFSSDVDLDKILADTERKYISAALEKTDWNRHKTAVLLGITERSLRYRMDKLDLSNK